MREDEFRIKLNNVPDAKGAVTELFEKARNASEQRFYLAIRDIEKHTKGNKSVFCNGQFRHLIVQQFAEYYNQIRIPIENNDNNMDRFLKRVRILFYSQFWECRGVQRLITQLIRIVNNEPYEPRLFLDRYDKTYNIFQQVVKNAAKNELKIGKFLEVIYNNQIRNAFVHSDFFIIQNH